jgi:glycosyltransferase involved in cell wall biosynthesis
VDEFSRDSKELGRGLRDKMRAFVGGLYAREAVLEFDRCLATGRYDVVHVHELYPLVSPWVLPRATAAGVPVVMSAYDFRLSCPVATHHGPQGACFRCVGGREHWCVIQNCRDNRAESLAYALRNASARWFGLYENHVARLALCSDYQRRFFVDELGLRDDRQVTIGVVIAVPDEPVTDPAAGDYVAYAGRFVPEKGVELMVQACRKLKLPMAFAGSASEHPAVLPGDDARFVMTKSRAELDAFYRGARMLVVPSIWAETFGIVAAESLAHGVPVVASRIGALPDTVLDDRTGLLAEPGNVDDLAAKIGRLWHDSELNRRLGRAGHEYVKAHWSASAHARALSDIYSRVMAEGPGGLHRPLPPHLRDGAADAVQRPSSSSGNSA